MAEPIITICIVHFNDADFMLNSLSCLEKLTKNSYQVFIMDNGSRLEHYHKLEKGVEKYANVFLERKETKLRGSLAHGTALNELVAKVDTPYFSVLDADATWLIKNWDEILINHLNDNIKTIGTQAEKSKPQDFPLMFAILFDTETFKKLDIDFRPKDLSKIQDTGWEMREKYLKAGYRGENIVMRNTRTYKEGPFKDLIGVAEYYLKGHSHIFASHFGRGATLGSAKYRKGTNFIYRLPILGRLPRKLKGRKEIKKWLGICQTIVNEQREI